MFAPFVMMMVVVMAAMVQPSASVRRIESMNAVEISNADVSKRGGGGIKSRLGLGPNVDLQVQDQLINAQGNTKKKYTETYQGLKVHDTIVDIEVDDDDDGDGSIVNFDIFYDFEDDIAGAFGCELSEADAKALTLTEFGMENALVQGETFENCIYVDDQNMAHYTTDVELYVIKSDGKPARPHAVMDNCDRKVLESFDRLGFFTVSSGSTDGSTAAYSTDNCSTDDYSTDDYSTDDYSTDSYSTGGSTDAGGSGQTDPTTAPPNPKTPGPQTPGPNTAPTQAPPGGVCSVKDKGGNAKCPIQFGTPGFCLHPMRRSQDGATCFLENRFVKAVDLKNSNDDSKTAIASFPCASGYDDEVNGGHSPMLDIFFFGTKSVLLYKDWYDFTPFKNNAPYVKAHFERNYQNAYWDGTAMVFGDGDGDSTFPWTGLDTVAHEFTHGVIEKTSNLAYREQSGGMNEALADMAGEVAEVYVFKKSDWLSGVEIFIGEGEVLRYFEDPTKDGHSIKHVDQYRSGMGVHSSSGVYNHVFWQMANVKGMGLRAAFECFLNADRLYWKENTNFEQGACGTVRGTYDAGYDMDVVADSFNVVGITLSGCSDLSAFVTASLKPDAGKRRLRVSKARQPLFKIRVPDGVSSVTVTGSDGVEVAISSSYKRSVSPMATGTGSATAPVSPNMVIYARFYKSSSSDNSELTNVTASVSFS